METDHGEAVLSRYADLQLEFERAEGYTYAARGEAVLMGLGFAPEIGTPRPISCPAASVNRLGIARLLLSAPDILLLDEPTNHLDVHAVEWLENFLSILTALYRHQPRPIFPRPHDQAGHRDRKWPGRQLQRELFEICRRARASPRTTAVRIRKPAVTDLKNRKSLFAEISKGRKQNRQNRAAICLSGMDRVESVAAEKCGGNFGLKKVERTGNNVLTTEDLLSAIATGSSRLWHKYLASSRRGCLASSALTAPAKRPF